MTVPVNTLVVMSFESNIGYAIAPLERMFYRLGLQLGGDDPTSVHFAYRGMSKGPPETLPQGAQAFSYDHLDSSSANIRWLADYVRTHRIELVVFFDRQPVGPIFRALRDAGVRTILSYWGAEISGRNSGWKLALKRLEVGLSRSKLDGLIFESRAMADLAEFGRGVPRHMIDVVPLGVDITRFDAARTDYVYDALSLPRDRQIIVYAGHMESRKGVRTLIEAAINLLTVRGRTDVQFLLFGNKADESAPFEAMYAGLDIAQHIRFAGYRSDLARCFPGCFVGVIPSSGWDSFPRTSIELAACGLPLVVSRLGGLPECIVDGETGFLFTPGDSRQLADRLEQLLDDNALAARMGAAGRHRCEQEFTLAVQEARMRAVIARRLGTAGICAS